MPKIIRPDVKVEVSAKSRQQLFDYVRERVREKYGIVGYDPVVEMALIANDPELSKMYDVRLRANERVAEYVHPKLTRTEVSGPDGGPIETKGQGVDELLRSIEELVRVQGGKKT